MELKPRTYTFETTTRWLHRGCSGTTATRGKPEVPVGCPPDFGGGGEPDRWSPEHLLTAAAETCLMATFTDMAKRRRIDLRAYKSRATARLTLVDGVFRFAGIAVQVRMTLGTSRARAAAESLIAKAAARCPVAASLNCPVQVTVDAATVRRGAGTRPKNP